jgi:putative methyltransferase (TIGR04325 family)
MIVMASPAPQLRPGWRKAANRALRLAVALPRAGAARLLAATEHSARFSGAYNSSAALTPALARFKTRGYDDESVVDVSFDEMCRRETWDYPILFWLGRYLPDLPFVLDAGGHLGTKYIAFSDLINLSGAHWTVHDLPGIVRAARARQNRGELPAAITFEDRLDQTPATDILLVSGFLPYLDIPFSEFVAALRRRPKVILLNKVAVRDGAEIFTIERIGSARVPYRIRNRSQWESRISAMGYEMLDSWNISEIGHVIPTHPWLGRSKSRGYALLRRDEIE